jgi:hypothetical protein
MSISGKTSVSDQTDFEVRKSQVLVAETQQVEDLAKDFKLVDQIRRALGSKNLKLI